MPSTTIHPTRMELTRLKGRLKTAQRGHKLLKDKRDELMKQFMDVVRENRALRRRVEEGLMRAHGSFTVAAALMSPEMLQQSLLYPKQSVELDMTFQIPVPSGASAGTYYLYFKVTADYYDANNNRHDREVLITAEVEVLEGTGSGSASSGSAGTAFAGVKPNDNDKVVSSNVHALLIADAGVSAPTATPGENAEGSIGVNQ